MIAANRSLNSLRAKLSLFSDYIPLTRAESVQKSLKSDSFLCEVQYKHLFKIITTFYLYVHTYVLTHTHVMVCMDARGQLRVFLFCRVTPVCLTEILGTTSLSFSSMLAGSSHFSPLPLQGHLPFFRISL